MKILTSDEKSCVVQMSKKEIRQILDFASFKNTGYLDSFYREAPAAHCGDYDIKIFLDEIGKLKTLLWHHENFCKAAEQLSKSVNAVLWPVVDFKEGV